MESPNAGSPNTRNPDRTNSTKWWVGKSSVGSQNSDHVLLTKNSTKSIPAFNSTSFIINSRHKPSSTGIYRVSIPGTSYRNFMNAKAYLWPLNKGLIKFCIDSGASISLINYSTLQQHFSAIYIHYMLDEQSIHLEGISNGLIMNEFVILSIELHGLND